MDRVTTGGESPLPLSLYWRSITANSKNIHIHSMKSQLRLQENALLGGLRVALTMGKMTLSISRVRILRLFLSGINQASKMKDGLKIISGQSLSACPLNSSWPPSQWLQKANHRRGFMIEGFSYTSLLLIEALKGFIAF